MGIPWRKILTGAKLAGKFFLPGVVSDAIDRIEDTVIEMKAEGKAGWSNPEKQQKALGVALDGLIAVEGALNRDLLDNPVVEAAGKRAIDAGVAFKQAVAEVQAAIELAKSAKVQDAA
jgi:hypothetical protein